MKTILIVIMSVVGLLVLLIGIAALIGSRLPIGHVAMRSILVHKPSEDVYKLVRDVGKTPTWRSDVKSVDLFR